MEETKIALGTWAWGAGAFGGDAVYGVSTNEENLKPVFEAAMNIGLNLWDTATVYGMGESERILGSFVQTVKRDSILVSTKFTPQLAEMYDNSVEKMANASMERMGIDYIDMYWIHNPMDVNRWTPGLIPLLKSGKVKKVGVSNHNIKEIHRANEILGEEGFKVSAVQNHYSLLYRSSEKGGVLDYCKENGIQFWSYMVLEQGALSGKYDTAHPFPEGSDRANAYGDSLAEIEELNKALEKIAEEHGVKVAQLPIAWAIAKGTLPIVGATKTHHVEDAAEAVDIELSADEIKTMEDLADKANINTIRMWEKEMK